jgi:uncharacterized protein YcfL
LEGVADKYKPEHTFKKLIQRHESLRPSFQTSGEKIVQQVHDEVEFEMEYYDMKGIEVEESEGTRGLLLCPHQQFIARNWQRAL